MPPTSIFGVTGISAAGIIVGESSHGRNRTIWVKRFFWPVLASYVRNYTGQSNAFTSIFVFGPGEQKSLSGCENASLGSRVSGE